MKICVNGSWCESRAADVAGVLTELGFGDAVVATALNGEFIPTHARSTAALSEGDRLEVLAPMQGG